MHGRRPMRGRSPPPRGAGTPGAPRFPRRSGRSPGTTLTAWRGLPQEVGDQAVGVFGQPAVIQGLAVLDHQQAREGGDRVLLRERALGVHEARDAERPAGEVTLDHWALLL